MHQETIKECLDMSVYAIVKAVNHLERMKNAKPERQKEIRDHRRVLCGALETLLNEKGKIGRLK